MSSQENSPSFTRIQLLGFMGVTAIILSIIAQIWRKLGSIQIIPLNFTVQALLFATVIAIGIFIASLIVAQIWQDYHRSAEQYLELIITPLVIPDLIWVAILPALSEELLFRGVMIPAFGYDLFAVIVSSILFGVLHLSDIQNWPYVVWAIIVGFILGYSAYITGNLLIPIVAHGLTNLFSSLTWKLRKIST
ncbi:CPBP family intramembrane glutamic endopeptidase [Geminocystis sp.]|uniref:CPBP family intramembrane glutamic endopeptidase n=1 Tax=Geminocystis sp. TaxID=2664100 RepID=UPI00359324E4